MHFEYANPKKAKGKCSSATFAFHNLLVDHKILHPPALKGTPAQKTKRIAKWIEDSIWDLVLDDEHDRYIAPEWYPNLSEGHTVNFVEGVVIDWTARQYVPNAPFPLIFTPKEKFFAS